MQNQKKNKTKKKNKGHQTKWVTLHFLSHTPVGCCTFSSAKGGVVVVVVVEVAMVVVVGVAVRAKLRTNKKDK